MVRAVLGRKHSTGRGWKDKQAVGGLAFRGGYGALSWDRRSLEIGAAALQVRWGLHYGNNPHGPREPSPAACVTVLCDIWNTACWAQATGPQGDICWGHCRARGGGAGAS